VVCTIDDLACSQQVNVITMVQSMRAQFIEIRALRRNFCDKTGKR